MEEATVETKQNYLCSEILDKGYDGEEFFNYLISIKGEQGGDLNYWNFEELKKTVNEFQFIIKNKINKNQNTNNSIENVINKKEETENKYSGFDKNINLKNLINEDILNNKGQNEIKEKNLDDINNNNKNDNEIIEIDCLGPEKGELSNVNNLKFILEYPEKTSDSSGFFGLFSKKIYITYQIQTQPLNLVVRRKINDFEWLRSTLINLYPGIFIPPIPLKSLSESASDKKIEKRMISLEKFLNELTRNPILKSSPLLYEFISTIKELNFSDIKKKYINRQKPFNLNSYFSRTGKIKLNKTLLKDTKQFDIMNQNIVNNISELTNLIKNYKLLFQEMKQVRNRINEISEIFNKLYSLSMKNSENKNLIKSYLSMEKLMKDWGYTEYKQVTNIELTIREYFKFLKLQYISIQELYDRFNYTNNLYNKTYEKLLYKKEELFKKGDVNKWELQTDLKFNYTDKKLALQYMLPKETEQVQFLSQLTYFYAHSFKEEFELLRNNFGQQNYQAYNEFYLQNYKVIQQLNNAWQSFFENDIRSNINSNSNNTFIS